MYRLSSLHSWELKPLALSIPKSFFRKLKSGPLKIVESFRAPKTVRLSDQYIDSIFEGTLKKAGEFLVYKRMQTATTDQNQWVFLDDYSDIAIILQGPIPEDSSFLLSTIMHYLNLFPKIELVISSWKEESFATFMEKCQSLPKNHLKRMHFLENEKPKNHGIANVNLQITSTLSALLFTEGLGKKFALKSRVDQVLTNHLCLSILKEKHNTANSGDLENEKIVIGSRNTFLFRPFSYSDMLQFSTTKTLISFWSSPLDGRNKDQLSWSPNSTPMEWSQQNLAEVYLTRNYLTRCGFVPDYDFTVHLMALVNYFAVVDSERLGFYWNKYTHNQSSWTRSDFPYTTYEVTEQDCMTPNFFHRNSKKFATYCDKPWR